MKREYEEFKVWINSYVAKAQKTPEEGWTMQDGIPWPGNNSRESYWNDLVPVRIVDPSMDLNSYGLGNVDWKREYEEFKVWINSYVAKAQKTPEEGWTMQDGIPWPGNNSRESYWNDLGQT
ncbi:unnamed protein product [Trifolium pratense]|uniref:Uncharacterized protein n=1 Tax=Trifolium pratense TaxID=57577 RepID=A0ACB0JM14_TRIPR|nr:unnamed protein product [Trifolium pratense]